MKQVVLVSGKRFTGKDTFADLLYEQLKQNGENVFKTHFADEFKVCCVFQCM